MSLSLSQHTHTDCTQTHRWTHTWTYVHTHTHTQINRLANQKCLFFKCQIILSKIEWNKTTPFWLQQGNQPLLCKHFATLGFRPTFQLTQLQKNVRQIWVKTSPITELHPFDTVNYLFLRRVMQCTFQLCFLLCCFFIYFYCFVLS